MRGDRQFGRVARLDRRRLTDGAAACVTVVRASGVQLAGMSTMDAFGMLSLVLLPLEWLMLLQ